MKFSILNKKLISYLLIILFHSLLLPYSSFASTYSCEEFFNGDPSRVYNSKLTFNSPNSKSKTVQADVSFKKSGPDSFEIILAHSSIGNSVISKSFMFNLETKSANLDMSLPYKGRVQLKGNDQISIFFPLSKDRNTFRNYVLFLKNGDLKKIEETYVESGTTSKLTYEDFKKYPSNLTGTMLKNVPAPVYAVETNSRKFKMGTTFENLNTKTSSLDFNYDTGAGNKSIVETLRDQINTSIEYLEKVAGDHPFHNKPLIVKVDFIESNHDANRVTSKALHQQLDARGNSIVLELTVFQNSFIETPYGKIYNITLDPTVVAHEISHAFQQLAASKIKNPNNPVSPKWAYDYRIFTEAFADYFSSSITGQSHIGRAFSGIGLGRDLTKESFTENAELLNAIDRTSVMQSSFIITKFLISLSHKLKNDGEMSQLEIDQLFFKIQSLAIDSGRVSLIELQELFRLLLPPSQADYISSY